MFAYDQLRKGEKTLQQVEKEQEDLKKDLKKITGNPKHKKIQQNTYTIKNANDSRQKIYDSRQKIIDLLNDNSRIRSKAICKASKKTTGTGLKILTPKQMLQRLPIALAQVKAGNNSGLLNEIRKIVYFLYQSKEITKNVYNNIIKSMKL